MKKLFRTLKNMLFAKDEKLAATLVGNWKSSKKLSLEQAIKIPKLEEHTIKFISEVTGVLEVTYTASELHMHGAPTKNITIKGELHDFVYEDITSSYEVISTRNRTVALLTHHPWGSQKCKINFIDENTYWTPMLERTNTREYFVRLH